MSAIGSWKLVLTTPLGKQTLIVTIKGSDEASTGTIEGRIGKGDVADLAVDGDKIEFVAALRMPAPTSTIFRGVVEGDSMTGTITIGNYPTSKFAGTREHADVR